MARCDRIHLRLLWLGVRAGLATKLTWREFRAQIRRTKGGHVLKGKE